MATDYSPFCVFTYPYFYFSCLILLEFVSEAILFNIGVILFSISENFLSMYSILSSNLSSLSSNDDRFGNFVLQFDTLGNNGCISM